MGRKVIEEMNNKYGRLTVIERGGFNTRGEATWFCECECGRRAMVVGARLRSGNTKSCGCLGKERRSGTRRLSTGEAAFNRLISQMRYSARRRGHVWSLTKDQVKQLTSQPCYYCGAKPNQCGTSRIGLNGSYFYNGLDRMDNEKGYTIDNVVSCCKICNVAKSTQTIEQFRAWIHNIYEHFVHRLDEV